MKLSLAWIFDHLDSKLADVDVHKLLERFTVTTAEIDYQLHVTPDFSNFALGKITAIDTTTQITTLFIAEWDKEITLPALKNRAKQLAQSSDQLYIIKRTISKHEIKNSKELYSYATLQDFSSEKEGVLPAVSCPPEEVMGGWKDRCDQEDYILTIDNKALTHRPDLWGHRGIAREMAALLGCSLLPEEKILSPLPVKNYDKKTIASPENPITLENDAPEMCTRLAGVFIREVTNKQSLPHIARRLACIDARPLNALVDATNYVMFDLGQPVHAFDATTFLPNAPLQSTSPRLQTGHLKAQAAAAGKEFTLLDGDTLTLTDQDCVITADTNTPLSLAGIMGGEVGGVTDTTRSLLIESAHFVPSVIRKSSMRHKKRTEASARFEKGLDPNQNTQALKRIVHIFNSWGICHTVPLEVLSVGKESVPKTISLTHDALVRTLGTDIPLATCSSILSKLGFEVQEPDSKASNKNLLVTVPTFRARDTNLPEDLIEEIARYVGYATLPALVPSRAMTPVDNHRSTRLRQIKRHCAFALGMHEVAQYPLFDEEFLRVLDWSPAKALELANPVSENWKKLVTTRIPQLFKALISNIPLKKQVRFFEWSKIWQFSPHNFVAPHNFSEVTSLAGLWFDPHGQLDFYQAKAQLTTLFEMLGMQVTWEKPLESDCLEQWFHPYQTARLQVGSQVIGHAGMANPFFMRAVLAEGNGWVFELDGDYLLEYTKPTPTFTPLAKYPHSDVDISMWVPVSVPVKAIEDTIKQVAAQIYAPVLIDYCSDVPNDNSAQEDSSTITTKKERAVTLRYTVGDEHKTLTRAEIDEIALKVKEAVERLGITVR